MEGVTGATGGAGAPWYWWLCGPVEDLLDEDTGRVATFFTSGSCLLVYKDYLQKGEGGAVNES